MERTASPRIVVCGKRMTGALMKKCLYSVLVGDHQPTAARCLMRSVCWIMTFSSPAKMLIWDGEHNLRAGSASTHRERLYIIACLRQVAAQPLAIMMVAT